MFRLRWAALVPATALLVAACKSDSGIGPEPAPTCIAPAPLLGRADARAPGYIAVYHDTVNATTETSRLAAEYDFQPIAVWNVVIRGFAATLMPPAVAGIRCEPTVRYVQHSGILTAHTDNR